MSYDLQKLSFCLIPISIYILELSASFYRRIYNHRSPFKGDRLHVHYLLRDKYNFSPHAASSLMGSFQAITCSLSVGLFVLWPSAWIFVFHFTLQALAYLLIGKSSWFVGNRKKFGLSILRKIFLKKKVNIISPQNIAEFTLIPLDPEQINELEKSENLDDNDNDNDDDDFPQAA